jgi:hypothetical protein
MPSCEDLRSRRDEIRLRAIRARRVRVAVLAAFRDVLILGGFVAFAAFGPGLVSILPAVGLVQSLLAPLTGLRDLLIGLPPLAGALDFLLGYVYWLLAALVVALPFVAVFQLARAFAWDHWDRAARDAVIRELAVAGLDVPAEPGPQRGRRVDRPRL